MQQQEQKHRLALAWLVRENRVRPSLFNPLWVAMGSALGYATRNQPMMCAQAVETVIGNHYNDQVRLLSGVPQMQPLANVLAEFRDDELEHRDTGLEHAEQPSQDLAATLIRFGCKVCIEIAKKI